MLLPPERWLVNSRWAEIDKHKHAARQAVMDRDWKVVKRVGRRMTLESGQEQRLIREPTRPYAKQLFHMATPGQVIDDETVELFAYGKVKPCGMKVSK